MIAVAAAFFASSGLPAEVVVSTTVLRDSVRIVSIAFAGPTLLAFCTLPEWGRSIVALPDSWIDSAPATLGEADLRRLDINPSFLRATGRDAVTYDFDTATLVRLGAKGVVRETKPFGALRDLAPVRDGYVVTFVPGGLKWTDTEWAATASAAQLLGRTTSFDLPLESLARRLLETRGYDTFLLDQDFRLVKPLLEETTAGETRAERFQHSRMVVPLAGDEVLVYQRFSPRLLRLNVRTGDQTVIDLEGLVPLGDRYGDGGVIRVLDLHALGSERLLVANGSAGLWWVSPRSRGSRHVALGLGARSIAAAAVREHLIVVADAARFASLAMETPDSASLGSKSLDR